MYVCYEEEREYMKSIAGNEREIDVRIRVINGRLCATVCH